MLIRSDFISLVFSNTCIYQTKPRPLSVPCFTREHVETQQPLPGGAIEGGGGTAGEILLDPLVVAHLRRHRDGGGLCPGRHHRGLSGGGLLLPGEAREKG